MILPLVLWPDPILQQVAAPVTVFDTELAELVQNMIETVTHHNGLGLAAPQVGVSKRVIVVMQRPARDNQPPVYMAIVNPVWRSMLDLPYEVEEGCLSIPDVFVKTARAIKIEVTGRNVKGARIGGDAMTMMSVCIQHEVDHLDGKVMYAHEITGQVAEPGQGQTTEDAAR